MNARQVLALKYRPKRFEDLIGQDTISTTLALALDTNRLSHAYLLSGLRGSGKTSTARIMAKSLVCENAPTSKPCEQCTGCQSANENRHLDIIEMDAASNRGIDDIKELIEHTKYKPTSAKYKVFIIDEVHMLTTQAFNALLKTLEEPPEFVKFILATTDPLKLPATILSRTQHFRFKRISDKNIIHHLTHILNIEDINFEIPALEMLTRSGQGSLRDTLTLLDQAIIYSKGTVTTHTVTDMLGMIDPSFLDSIFDIVLSKGDIRSVIESLESYEVGQVLDEISIYLKQKMLMNDPKFDILIFDRFFRIIADSKQLLNMNSDSGFVLILTFSKMVEAVSLKTIDEVIEQINNTEASLSEIIEDKKEQLVKNVQDQIPKQQIPLDTQIAPKQTNENIVNEPIVRESIPSQIEVQENVETTLNIKEKEVEKIDKYEKMFSEVVANIYEKNYQLGECFEKSFSYSSYENNILKINSIAQGDCKTLLYKNFSHIKNFIEEVYGEHTELEFDKIKKENTKETARSIKATVKTPSNDSEPANDNSVGSMIEDIEMNQPSGCVSGMGDIQNPNMAQQEVNINDVLNSKMAKTVIQLFQPTTPPRVKSKL
ncbi:MAG: DNA polymerase III subunit gamma/tau [Campylobacterota bacterium]|nr:DNA polymerase III subunit gamma/tau [Campylobacterota bacterium]